MIWSNVNAHMESSKEVTLLDTPDIKVQAGLDIMALANRKESKIQKKILIAERNSILETDSCYTICGGQEAAAGAGSEI